METIELYGFQLDFIRELLLEYQKSKYSDRDTRLMAKDILDAINAQAPEKVWEISLLTGKLIPITVDEGR